MFPSTKLVFAGLSGIVFVVILWKRVLRPRSTLAKLAGPPSPSWIFGNIFELNETESVGERDRTWVHKYGPAFKLSALYGTEVLYLADPKAMHYVLDTNGYAFGRINKKIMRLLMGPMLLATDGKDHARQRKVLLPGFTQRELQKIVPIFSHMSEKLEDQWKEMLTDENSALDVDIHSWLSRLALDAVGQGVFSYDFGALSDTPSEFLVAYRDVFFNMFHKRSRFQILVGQMIFSLPFSVLKMLQSLAFSGTMGLNKLKATGRKIGEDIIQREIQASRGEVPQGRDIMSNLVRANIDQKAKEKLSQEELLSQTMAITVAGHDTTAATLSWAFFELARHPECQEKMRAEVMSFKKRTAACGGTRVLQASDLDSFPYTSAIVKETLRYYPVAAHSARVATSDVAIPLSEPIQTLSHETMQAIPIEKGQVVFLGLWSYNRSTELWGVDADEWNPERFLSGKLLDQPQHALGVYANLATFGSGVYSCIGWRFAILEMHSILITLIEKFEFGPSSRNVTVLPKVAATVYPVVKGQEEKGAQLPLTVRVV